MADGPELALQAALIARCRAAGAVTAEVGQRTYDEPPDIPTRPYIRLGNLDAYPVRADGCLSWRILFALEVHSRPNQGRVEAARIGRVLVDLFNDGEAGLPVMGFDVSWLDHQATVTSREPDGKSYESTVAFEAMLTAQ